ncbi:putative translation elongation factor eEF-1B gamma subunit [Calocera cornea HHB12733]|uniref:Putative translation elongation factor eEF-1B gamma subunit n=1 Tax=Calocera cornea HHB12733 TaxID=1353952 RepID=A0A165DSM1_9BASI|nr:putative translation elongation factor eEF-1B gamma subunit [Calocera cornea HHB12733]
MSVGTLYTFSGLPFGKRVRAVAAAAGLKVDEPLTQAGKSNKTAIFVAKFPNAKFPAFEAPDGFKLFESSAIARYLASLAPDAKLLGTTAQETALVDQWISFADNEVRVPMINALMILRGTAGAYSQEIEHHWRQRVIPHLEILDAHLKDNTFLVGNNLTIADLTLATIVQQAFTTLVDRSARAKLPSLVEWYDSIVNLPTVKDVYGETAYIDVALQYQSA